MAVRLLVVGNVTSAIPAIGCNLPSRSIAEKLSVSKRFESAFGLSSNESVEFGKMRIPSDHKDQGTHNPIITAVAIVDPVLRGSAMCVIVFTSGRQGQTERHRCQD